MKSIKIYGWDVPIVKVKNLAVDHGILGAYDYESRSIHIDADLKGPEHMSTLIHELVHALFHRAGLHQAKIPTSLEEVIAEQVSTVLAENFTLAARRKR